MDARRDSENDRAKTARGPAAYAAVRSADGRSWPPQQRPWLKLARGRDGGRGLAHRQRGEHADHERPGEIEVELLRVAIDRRGSQQSSARSRPAARGGFTRQPADALLVAEIADLTLHAPPPPGIELRGGRSARARDGRRWLDCFLRAWRRRRREEPRPRRRTLPDPSPWNTPDVGSAILDRHRCQGQMDGMRGHSNGAAGPSTQGQRAGGGARSGCRGQGGRERRAPIRRSTPRPDRQACRRGYRTRPRRP